MSILALALITIPACYKHSSKTDTDGGSVDTGPDTAAGTDADNACGDGTHDCDPVNGTCTETDDGFTCG